jgi:hypothetical protein
MFELYMGRKQAAAFKDPLTRKGCELWLERLIAFYGEGGGVDVEIVDSQLPLTEETMRYIYSDFTPLDIKYVKGTRPLLEKVVADNVSATMSAREKALALMRRVRDNRTSGLASPNLFYGGNEEELLKRGALMGNEVARLFVCLCQIAGLPARTHSAHISGHMAAEVYAGGKWGWMDPMEGIAPVNDKDEPASAWELFKDPKLFERQPQCVWDDIRPAYAHLDGQKSPTDDKSLVMARTRDCYFHPREAMAIGNYFAWDHLKYTYPWRMNYADPVKLEQARHLEHLNRKAMGLPDYYFNYYLFMEVLRPRRQA